MKIKYNINGQPCFYPEECIYCGKECTKDEGIICDECYNNLSFDEEIDAIEEQKNNTGEIER